jgi:hypothetical protein
MLVIIQVVNRRMWGVTTITYSKHKSHWLISLYSTYSYIVYISVSCNDLSLYHLSDFHITLYKYTIMDGKINFKFTAWWHSHKKCSKRDKLAVRGGGGGEGLLRSMQISERLFESLPREWQTHIKGIITIIKSACPSGLHILLLVKLAYLVTNITML